MKASSSISSGSSNGSEQILIVPGTAEDILKEDNNHDIHTDTQSAALWFVSYFE